MIKVLPSVDISEGKAVKRIRGVKGTGLILGDPVKIAYKMYEEGYNSIHVIDLDSAEGVGNNEEYIKEICKIGFKWIQVGGGIRSLDRAKKLISLGVSAIILSTLPFTNFKEFKHILDEIGKNKVLVSIDYDNDRKILIKGWKEKSIGIEQAIETINNLNVLGIILTYVTNEGTAKGVDHNVKSLVDKIKGIKEYAGGVSSLSDIQFLESVGFNYVIVGMAFYLNKLREGGFGENV